MKKYTILVGWPGGNPTIEEITKFLIGFDGSGEVDKNFGVFCANKYWERYVVRAKISENRKTELGYLGGVQFLNYSRECNNPKCSRACLMTKSQLLDSVGEFLWTHSTEFLVKVGNEYWVWSDPDYQGDNSFRKWVGTIQQYSQHAGMHDMPFRDKGKHLIRNYVGEDIWVGEPLHPEVV